MGTLLMQMMRLAVLAVLALASAATAPSQRSSLPDAVSMLETRARLMRMLAMDNATVTAASSANTTDNASAAVQPSVKGRAGDGLVGPGASLVRTIRQRDMESATAEMDSVGDFEEPDVGGNLTHGAENVWLSGRTGPLQVSSDESGVRCKWQTFGKTFERVPVVVATLETQRGLARGPNAGSSIWIEAVATDGFNACAYLPAIPSSATTDGNRSTTATLLELLSASGIKGGFSSAGTPDDSSESADSVGVSWFAFGSGVGPAGSQVGTSEAFPLDATCVDIPLSKSLQQAPVGSVRVLATVVSASAEKAHVPLNAWVEAIDKTAFTACYSRGNVTKQMASGSSGESNDQAGDDESSESKLTSQKS